MIGRILRFVSYDIWRVSLRNYKGVKAVVVRYLMIAMASVKGFNENKGQLRASALTYYSLLSIVPVIAMAFGVAKGFSYEKVLEAQLLEKFPAQKDVFVQIFAFANTMLENTKGGLIAGIGVAVLFWTVIKVLSNIEESFNGIWGIGKQRSITRKFSDYLSMMLICPVLVVVSSGITVFISTQIVLITEKIALLGSVAPFISFLIKSVPYAVIWILFTFIYIFMPNTKVNIKSAIFAGITAGTVYQVVQFVYLKFQVGAANYNAIYGSFAAIPLFLVWLQSSWLIVLFGAELSYAHQNVEMFEFEPDCARISGAFKKQVAVKIALLIKQNFVKGGRPLSIKSIVSELNIPLCLADHMLSDLLAAGIITEIVDKDRKFVFYQPAQDPAKLTENYIIDSIETYGVNKLGTLP